MFIWLDDWELKKCWNNRRSYQLTYNVRLNFDIINKWEYILSATLQFACYIFVYFSR